jgi:N-acetylmuramoyl-L-alanine amidase
LYAHAGLLTPVKLRVQGKEVALKTPAVSDGREVYLPLDALAAFKATFVVTRREESVIVTPASGGSFEIALARPGRETMVPLSALTKQLKLPLEVHGAVCDVDAPAAKSEPTAHKEPTREQQKPAVREAVREPVKEPVKEIVKDQKVASAPAGGAKQVETTGRDLSSQTDAIQSPGSLDAPRGPRNAVLVSNPTRTQPTSTNPIAVASGEPSIFDEDIKLTLPPSGTQEAKSPSANPQFQAPLPRVNVLDVVFEPLDDKSARIRVKTDGRPDVDVRLLRAPTRLSIDFNKTGISAEQREWSVDHPFLSAMHLVQGDKPTSTRLVVELAELIGYVQEEPTADGVTINLMVPRGVGKKLRGLKVTVDPGHGGSSSTGCSWVVNGVRVFEKELTLDIGKRLRALLTECGVDVIMTRTSDNDPGLEVRPQIANRNKADLFTSIHIDDCGIQNSASGTTAYYHMDDASSRALAHSIAENIGKVSGLPVRGAWSDRRRFPASGMAVLRGSRMPATLVEVAYINNSRDRAKLLDPGFRQTIAQAIFDGIKGYIKADLPDADIAAEGDTK